MDFDEFYRNTTALYVMVYKMCLYLDAYYDGQNSTEKLYRDTVTYVSYMGLDTFTKDQFLAGVEMCLLDPLSESYPLPDQLMRYILPKLNIYSSSKTDYI